MFYMEGTRQHLIAYEYDIIADGRALSSGIVEGYSPGNARALIKIISADLLQEMQ